MSRDEILHSVPVTFEHRVVFTDGLFESHNSLLSELMPTDARRGVFVDQGALDAQPNLASKIERSLNSRVLPVPGGEACKQDPAVIERAIAAIHNARICRHSYVVIVGGGAVLDAIGYAASLVHRGVRQIRVPSTVLAQADAGIGIKNGVDYAGKKNFLGVFYPPHAVINDSRLLESLDSANWRDGMAEAVKVALIRDREFFEWIEANTETLIARGERGMAAMRMLIRRCAELHLRQIAHGGDPFERGSARPLDYGHWSAHKIEQLSGFTIGHGHAVAVGMAIDALYAAEIGWLAEADAARVRACLERLGFDLAVGKRIGSAELLLDGLAEFQEHLGGELSISLLTGIGTSREVHELDGTRVSECAKKVLGDNYC